MNLADLGALLTVLSAAMSGAAAAQRYGTGLTSFLLALAGLVAGLLIGLTIAFAAGRIAYAALDRSLRARRVMRHAFTFIYCVVPCVSIFLATAAPMFLAQTILA